MRLHEIAVEAPMIAVPKAVLVDTIARVEWMWTYYHLNAAKRSLDRLTGILDHTHDDIVQVPLDLLTRAREDVRQAVTTRFTDEDRALARRLDDIIATATARPVGGNVSIDARDRRLTLR